MKAIVRYLFSFWIGFLLMSATELHAVEADDLIQGYFHYMRDKSSIATVSMHIHRARWQRDSTFKVWTRGEKDSLISVLSPRKDRGNGTLKLGRSMWLYNPKINRTIKLPPSMMSQSWMGSDFSNNDLAKSDSLIIDYDHSIVGQEELAGKIVYHIKAVPKPEAPVVWEQQIIKVREDYIPVEVTYFDEALKPVKRLTFYDVEELGGKLFPRRMRMVKSEDPEAYTEIHYQDLLFNQEIGDRVFSLTALKSPPK